MHDHINDSEKVLRKHTYPKKQFIIEPTYDKENTIVDTDYNKLTKNQLVKLLWNRGIHHNKRQLKAQLVSLLIKDDHSK